jgi:hypothetical protein
MPFAINPYGQSPPCADDMVTTAGDWTLWRSLPYRLPGSSTSRRLLCCSMQVDAMGQLGSLPWYFRRKSS